LPRKQTNRSWRKCRGAFGDIQAAAQTPTVEQLVRQAGDAEDDAVRLKILKQIQAKPDVDEGFRAEAGRLVASPAGSARRNESLAS